MLRQYNRFEKFKVLFHQDRLRDIADSDLCWPLQWIIYPSNECNLNCGFCIMREERSNGGMLPESVMEKIPADADRMGIKNVIFSGGGEPLYHPRISGTLEGLRKKGIMTGLLTNGQFLTEEIINNLDTCRVSVDAATSQTYKKVKGVNAFGRLESKLNLFRFSPCELGLAFLITPDNITEMYRFCEWAEQFSPAFIHLRPMYDKENTMVQFADFIKKQKDFIEKDFKNAYVRTDKFLGYWTPKLFSKCRATPLIAVLNADGRFSVCQDVFIKFGNYIAESFEDCWFTEEHHQAINSIDINLCPRCVENGYNEIIEQCVLSDSLRRFIL